MRRLFPRVSFPFHYSRLTVVNLLSGTAFDGGGYVGLLGVLSVTVLVKSVPVRL